MAYRSKKNIEKLKCLKCIYDLQNSVIFLFCDKAYRDGFIELMMETYRFVEKPMAEVCLEDNPAAPYVNQRQESSSSTSSEEETPIGIREINDKNSSVEEDARNRDYIKTKKETKMKRFKPRNEDGFGCRDIFFGLFNENINHLEPIVYGFARESEILLNLTREITLTERVGITNRAFIAKEIANNLNNELKDKFRAISKLKKMPKILTYGSRNRIRFMRSRFYEMNQRMEVAATNIDISLEAFSQRTEISLAQYNKRLNKIMLALTLSTICFIPPQVIGGIMGMNVKVPFQDTEDSLVPFYLVIGLMTVLVIIIMFTIRLCKVDKGW